ncbi:MAG: MFS transporter [Oscillospiraceae bacterium]|nr:MFS transporter [Oscillospiraceae bacterium]
MLRQFITQYGGLKREVYILFVGKMVTAMGSFVWPMLTFFLTTKLNLSDGTATMLIATATLLFLPAALFGGKLADRFSRKGIIVFFDCLTVSLYFLAAMLPLNMGTAVILFFAGLFQTMESPAYDALNADYSTSGQREKAYSLSYLGFNLGYIVGASVAGVLFEKYIRLAFCINALAVFSSTVLIFFFVHKENAISEEEKSLAESYSEYEYPVDDKISVMTLLRQRPVLLGVLLLGCVAAMPSNLMGVLLPLQLKETMGEAGAAIYGYLNSLNGFVVIVFTPIFTVVLKRITEIPKTVIGLLLFIAGNALFTFEDAVAILFVGMFVFTLGEVVTVLGSKPYASRRVPASHRGRVGGISNLTHSVCTSLTQYLISFLLVATGSNYYLIWWVFNGIGFAAGAAYLFLYGPDKRAFPKLYENK